MIEEEQEQEVVNITNALPNDNTREEPLDLEATEFFIRTHMLKLGASILQRYLQEHPVDTHAPQCAENHMPVTMKSTAIRPKTFRTILGPIRLRRHRYQCPVCRRACYPADALLGVGKGRFSPGLQRLMAHVGAMDSFGHASEDLELLAHVKVDAKDVERTAEKVGEEAEAWMQTESGQARLQAAAGRPVVEEAPEHLYVSFDGTGVPMTRRDLEGRKGKNGPAKTREVKVGCVFTQTAFNDEGLPVRDEASTSYVAAIENSTDFGHRIHAEAIRRGLCQAKQTTVLTDGQNYNMSIVSEHFTGARHIIDIHHAREHLGDFVRDVALGKIGDRWHQEAEEALFDGCIEALVDMFRQRLPRSGPRRTIGLREIGYFENNKERMRYADFRRQGCFIGSGVVEAACGFVVGQRLKNSGMFWSLRGANSILALRCSKLSNRFEDFWESKAA